MSVTFADKLSAWREASYGFIQFMSRNYDQLHELNQLPDHIVVLYNTVMGFDIYVELERYILQTADSKIVEGLIISVEKSVIHHRNLWESDFDDAALEKARHFKILYGSVTLKQVIYHYSSRVKSDLYQLNRIKELYTSLGSVPDAELYKINYRKYAVQNGPDDLTNRKFSFDDWKAGEIEKAIVDHCLKSGSSIEQYVLKDQLVNLINNINLSNEYEISEEREYLRDLLLNFNYCNYRVILTDIFPLVSVEDWYKILDCQKQMYDVYVSSIKSEFIKELRFMEERCVNVELLHADLIREINELFDGSKKRSRYCMLHSCEEISEAFADIKKGLRETRNLTYNHYLFDTQFENKSDFRVIGANAHCVAEAAYLFMVFLTERKSAGNAQMQSNDGKTVRMVLYHYYLQQAQVEPAFEAVEGQSKQAVMKAVGRKYGVSGDAFRLKYYSLSKSENRIKKSNCVYIKEVITLLKDFPEVQLIAKKELNQAELLT